MNPNEKIILVCLIAEIVEDRNSWMISRDDLRALHRMSNQFLGALLYALVSPQETIPDLEPIFAVNAIPAIGKVKLIRFGTWLDVLKWVERGFIVYFKDPEFSQIIERTCRRSVVDPTRIIVSLSVKYGLSEKMASQYDLNSFYRPEP